MQSDYGAVSHRREGWRTRPARRSRPQRLRKQEADRLNLAFPGEWSCSTLHYSRLQFQTTVIRFVGGGRVTIPAFRKRPAIEVIGGQSRTECSAGGTQFM